MTWPVGPDPSLLTFCCFKPPIHRQKLGINDIWPKENLDPTRPSEFRIETAIRCETSRPDPADLQDPHTQLSFRVQIERLMLTSISNYLPVSVVLSKSFMIIHRKLVLRRSRCKIWQYTMHNNVFYTIRIITKYMIAEFLHRILHLTYFNRQCRWWRRRRLNVVGVADDAVHAAVVLSAYRLQRQWSILI